MTVVARLRDAMNAHDLEGFLDCFHEDYKSEQPIHPDAASAVGIRFVKTGRRSSRGCQTSKPSCWVTVPAEAKSGPNGVGPARAGTVVRWTWPA